MPAHRPHLRHLARPSALLLVPALLALGACGSGDDSQAVISEPAPTLSCPATPAAADTTYPATVTVGGSSVTLDAAPQRIVSLSPTATEMLFAIGAGCQVVAVDDQSDYPVYAPVTDLSGYTPSAEAVSAHDPDLVVLAADTDGVVDQLTALGVPVLVLPAAASLKASYAQEKALGEATGHQAGAAAVVADTTARIDAAVASVPTSETALSVYHEVDQTYYSLTSDTFAGSIYTRFGLTNIADAAPGAAAAGGYPQLSAEYVVQSQPDLIVLADGTCCGQTAATVAERDGWAQVPAVAKGTVVNVDDDIASRWGPRTADFAEAVAQALTQL